MSNEVLSEESQEDYCERMQKCYPQADLKRFLIALLGVAVVFVVAAFIL